MKKTGEFTATLNVKKLGNQKTNPDYDLRQNQETCKIELKPVDQEEWAEGGELKPYGEPFHGYDAF